MNPDNLVDGPKIILVPADQTSVKIEEDLQAGLIYTFQVLSSIGWERDMSECCHTMNRCGREHLQDLDPTLL